MAREPGLEVVPAFFIGKTIPCEAADAGGWECRAREKGCGGVLAEELLAWICI